MDPEEQMPEDNGQQGDETSSNAFPGQAQNFYNRVGLKKVANKILGSKTAGKAGKVSKINRGVQAAGAVGNAGNNNKSGFQSINAIFEILSPLPLPPFSSDPFSAKTMSSTPKLVFKLITSLVGKLGGTIFIIKILVIILVIFLLKETGVLGISTYSNHQLSASGPIFAKIGDKLDYTITVNYPSTAKDIIVTDRIPDGTEYINAHQGRYDPATNTVTWNMPATASATISLALLATKDNNYIINTLKGTILGGVLGEKDSQLSTLTVTPTLFQTIPNTTPTVFQLAPTNIPISPQDTNVIKSCVITKIGEPVIIPSLPPECTNF